MSSALAARRAHSAVLNKWGRSTLAFFPMRNTQSGVWTPPNVVVGAGIQHIWLLTKVGVTVDLPASHQQLRIIMTSTDIRCPHANDEPISASQRNEQKGRMPP